MSYSPPEITSTGLTIPTYLDIQAELIAQYQNTFGQAVYLGVDSPDYQDISICALFIYALTQALQEVYNSFNPQTALGGSLDLLGRLIGTARKPATASGVNLTLTGVAGTVITNGVARDVNGNYWSLGSSVTIGLGGTVIAPAQAQQLGSVTANPGEISYIATPTAGWTGVTNVDAASLGQPIELDSTYRARLLISQTKPSMSLRAGTEAANAAVLNVTRSIVYENTQSFTSSKGFCDVSGSAVYRVTGYPFDVTMVGEDIFINTSEGVFTSYSISSFSDGSNLAVTGTPGSLTGVAFYVGDGNDAGPAHSITCVVEGGLDADIAQAIYSNRGIGCYVNGSVDVAVTDPNNPTITMTMRYDILSYAQIAVAISVRPLAGYTSSVGDEIVAGVVSYLNSLGIGETVVYSELFRAALTGNSGAGAAASPNPDQPVCSIRSITFGVVGSPTILATDDVPVDYNSAAQGSSADVTLTLV